MYYYLYIYIYIKHDYDYKSCHFKRTKRRKIRVIRAFSYPRYPTYNILYILFSPCTPFELLYNFSTVRRFFLSLRNYTHMCSIYTSMCIWNQCIRVFLYHRVFLSYKHFNSPACVTFKRIEYYVDGKRKKNIEHVKV